MWFLKKCIYLLILLKSLFSHQICIQKTLILYLSLLEMEKDVICSRCGEYVEAQTYHRIESGLKRLAGPEWSFKKGKERWKVSGADSTVARAVAIPAMLLEQACNRDGQGSWAALVSWSWHLCNYSGTTIFTSTLLCFLMHPTNSLFLQREVSCY